MLCIRYWVILGKRLQIEAHLSYTRFLILRCGSGLSGEVLSDNGHYWVGLDISSAMLDVAIDREIEGDVTLGDMGDGLPFRAGSFDGAIR